jgi:hypothetical protein
VLTEVDIYGINTYGDIESVKGVLTNGNYTGAYMITEWGPNGHWESPKTIWGMSIEQTSSEKAAVYLKRYQTCIAADSAQCMGSFAFYPLCWQSLCCLSSEIEITSSGFISMMNPIRSS